MRQIKDKDIEKISVLTSSYWQDYALLDSGNRKKLERFGEFRFVRPEPQALWMPRLKKKRMGCGRWDFSCFGRGKRGEVDVFKNASQPLADEISRSEILGKSHAVSPYWRISGTGSALGMDPRENKKCGAASEGSRSIWLHRPCDSYGRIRRRGSNVRRCVS